MTEATAPDLSRNHCPVGLGIAGYPEGGSTPLEAARLAERLGFDFVTASDHPAGTTPSYEVLTSLTWILAGTQRIAVGTRVLGVPFRRPAMIAKAVQTMQELSGGRMILGLGGGHVDAEIVALGGDQLSPGRKVAGLRDAIEIIRGAWSGREFSYVGTEHRATSLVLSPRPAPAPIWLGTYGPRALAVTGRLADGWVPTLGHAEPAQVPAMLETIRTAAAEANRPDGSVRAILNLEVRIGRRLDDAHLVSGSTAEVVEQLLAFRALGFDGFNLVASPDDVVRVGHEVLPALRAAPPSP